jgi:uncharacterized protein
MSTIPTDGAVASLWRYPVKSMMGEEVNAADFTEVGVFGDRAYALLDTTTGKVASAKHPAKWPNMFRFRSSFQDSPMPGAALPPVRVTLPGGDTISTTDAEFDSRMSSELGRPVALLKSAPKASSLEEYWPDIEGLALREAVTDEAMPEGTFFDLAVLHILTTGTINRLRELYPSGRFEVRRFRPNLVIDTPGATDFVENDWIGKTLAIGPEVQLKITGPCPRCVMTTLPQYDLPKDPGILRTAVQHNAAHVGVYAAITRPGRITMGDTVEVI